MRNALKIGFDVMVVGGFVAFMVHLSLQLPEPARQWVAEASKGAASQLMAQLF